MKVVIASLSKETAMTASVEVDRVQIGNHAANTWQGLDSRLVPTGTDVKVYFNIRGVGRGYIETAMQRLQHPDMSAVYVSLTGVICWVVIGRQNVFELRKPDGIALAELTTNMTSKVLIALQG